MGKVHPAPVVEPVDLSETVGLTDEEISPSSEEMLAKQAEIMRQRELEAQERQAKKFGPVQLPRVVGDMARVHPAPVPGNSSYRWVFEDGANVVELHNVPFDLADSISTVLDDFHIKYTRYQQVPTWAEG